ncbi:MAG: hypothetical protein BGP09_32210 [Rhizobium sp. 60-20]|jgi:hypothetical protein|nr:MAG: hypothetical protein BGP09_32210 [Rhizobium sp. 60-20]RKD72736.1 hypothetical protein BJ928_102523 [Rhizobium sp. WW_1]
MHAVDSSVSFHSLAQKSVGFHIFEKINRIYIDINMIKNKVGLQWMRTAPEPFTAISIIQ